jgi:Bacterial archaeo-eukaryotic release factor family 10
MKLHSSATTHDLSQLSRHISQLANLTESESPVISGYLDLRQSKDSLKSKLAIWAVAARSTLSPNSRSHFDAARQDLLGAIVHDWPDEVRSVAVFCRRGEDPLLLVIPFSAPMDLHFDVSGRPAIFQLVQLKDRFHRFVVVIATEDTSKIIEVTLGAVSESILTQRPERSSRLGREWGREHFHQRKREWDHRFYRDQVTIIADLMAKRGLNHLILAGNPHHVAGLREVLPKQLETQLVGEIHKTPSGGDHSSVLELAIQTFVEAERAESRSTVSRLHEQICRGGLGVVGVADSRAAIVGGYAAELVISEELAQAEREELTRLATAHKLAIEVCEGDELLAAQGGVGCLLRYRPELFAGETA